MATDEPRPDERARHVWSLGSYPDIAPEFLRMAAQLVDAAGVDTDDRVLDVGCGTGNVAITAARRGAHVTGIDITPSMLESARENSAVAAVDSIDWQEGDASDLPFDDDAFDVTLSCVGHMFAEPAADAARELLRVTRPGGTVAFTSWTPTSVVPAMSMDLVEFLPPDAGPTEPPFMWGDTDTVRDRLGDGVEDVRFETDVVLAKVLSPQHYWETAATDSGIFIAALDQVDDADLPELRSNVIETIQRFFDDSQNVIPMEYLRTVATVA